MNDAEMMREPTQLEKAIFDALLSVSFPGREELRIALNSALVSNIDDIGSLKIRSRTDKVAKTVKQVPVEAETIDDDGVHIHILLHVRGGMPVELEIYKEDGSLIIGDIEPSRINIIVLPPHKGGVY